MRVLLDTTFAQRGPSGTAVYVTELARALRGLGVQVVEAANPRRRAPGAGGPRSVANLVADEWWTQVELPRRAAAAGVDVVHHPLPALALRAPVAQVVTVHDLAFELLPGLFAPGFRRWARLAHRRAARGAGAVVAVSQATADDLGARWGVTRSVVVAPHGPGQELAVPPRRPRHLLYVGDDEPRKDLATLRAAHARAAGAPPLVLAGRAHGGREVTREELADLYAGAVALVHPSRHEGFGLTLVEAMAAGVPVIAADTRAARELCGDAARYFPPGDAAALARMLEQPGADGEAGRVRATALSWAASARAHVEAYSLAGR